MFQIPHAEGLPRVELDLDGFLLFQSLLKPRLEYTFRWVGGGCSQAKEDDVLLLVHLPQSSTSLSMTQLELSEYPLSNLPLC